MSDYICKELIFEIFTKLPPKSLLRFRTLSKSLCSYISSSDFIRLHALRSQQKLLIVHQILNKEEHDAENFYTLHSKDELPTCPKRGYIGTTPIHFPYYKFDDKIVGSCFGILCVVNYREYHITLWNPLLRRKLTLSTYPRRYSGRIKMEQIEFAFDRISDDFKILCIPANRTSEKNSFVYAVKTGTWCEIASPAYSFIFRRSVRGCFFNRALHWVVKSKSDYAHSRHIMTFDLSTHVFGSIALPEAGWETSKDATTIHGSLAVISTRLGDKWIWVMKEYNNTASWSVVFKLKENEFGGHLHRVLQPTNNGDFLFITFVNGFQLYDPKTGSRSILPRFNADDCYMAGMEMCVESLQLFDIQGMEACEGNRLSILEAKRRHE